MAEILLAIESARSRAPQLSDTRLLNFMTERQPPDAKGQAPLFGCPGLKSLTMAGSAATRGSWNFNNTAYFVQGSDLYSVSAGGAAIQVGSGVTSTGPVGMADNGQQLCIVNGVSGWIYTVANGLQPITSSAFYPAKTVSFMDGYFIFDRLGTNQFFLSALYDGLTYNALDFATAEAAPGQVVCTRQNLQLLYIFTTSHIELWYDAGTADFPFQRYAGGVIPYGCSSPYSVVLHDGSLFFLGNDKIFYRLNANVPVRVSTHPMELLFSLEADLSAIVCTKMTIQGHKLIFMNLPTNATTVCYDISTGKWHERDSFSSLMASLGGWRGAFPLEIYGQILVGDTQGGQIGEVDWSTYTEYGNTMFGQIQSSNQHHDRKRIFCSRFELDVQAGVGLTTGQGSDPQIMLRRSIDGGMTWSKQQLWRSMGRIGAYQQRLRWLGQGAGFQMSWLLEVSDPVPRTIISAHADIAGLP